MTHTDEGALRWLREEGVETLLDVGCSVGGQIDLALSLGIDAYGLDGDYTITANPNTKCLDRIFFNDLTKTHVLFPTRFDAIWCCEVAEHVEERFVENLMRTLCGNLSERNGILVFTANDGPGYHHVNRKPMSWWIELLKKYGLVHSVKATEELRAVSTMQREFIRNTGNVFRRTI